MNYTQFDPLSIIHLHWHSLTSASNEDDCCWWHTYSDAKFWVQISIRYSI